MNQVQLQRLRNRAALLAEKASNPALALLCVLNLLLGVVFVFSLAFAAQTLSARAEQADTAEAARCNARDLLALLREESPQKLAIVEQEAETIVNGEAVFWKISGENREPSWLLGTMHSPDPRITQLPEAAEQAFERADIVMIENVEALEPAQMAKQMAMLRDHIFLAEGETLEALIEPENLAGLKAAIAARNMPWQAANRMQPWMVAASIAVPSCDATAKRDGTPVLDALIAKRAIASEKQLIGLETVEEQFKAVASIPFDFHVNALNETVQLGALADDLMETTKILYLQGRTGMMLPLVRAFAPKTYDGKGYAAFQELLLTDRNRNMAERAQEHLERGNAFIAVGALHLPGEDGLVALLEEAGYTVKPVSR